MNRTRKQEIAAIRAQTKRNQKARDAGGGNKKKKKKRDGGSAFFSRLRDDTDTHVSYSDMETEECSERRTFMRGGTALDLYVEPGASFRGHHWRTMLKTMYADKLPAKFDLYHARGKVDMAALVDGNMTINKV